MSYDLNIYGSVPASVADLVDAASGVVGVELTIDSETNEFASVLNPQDGASVFSIDGPYDLDPDDRAGDTVEFARMHVLYRLVVHESKKEYVASALEFGRKLATRLDGIVVDPQVDTPHAERAPAPSDEQRSYLHLDWFRSIDGAADLADIYLSAARELLPAAIPTRFGTNDPLKGKFPSDDFSEFGNLYREHCALTGLVFKGRTLVDGNIWGWMDGLRPRYQAIQISLDLEQTLKRHNIEAVQDFFIQVARRSGSFFAFVELNTSRLQAAEQAPFEGGWSGLPAVPQWMTWYTPEYAEMVSPYLSGGRWIDFPDGHSHQWADLPADETQLQLLSKRVPWVDDCLLPTLSAEGNGEVLQPARVMPPSLRRPSQSSPTAQRIEENIARNRSKEVRQ